MMTVRISKTASHDIQDAVSYYNKQQKGLGGRFAEVIKVQLGKIADFPLSCTLINEDVRFKVVEKFPYIITFTIRKNSVYILRVFNTYLNPQAL